ncbi:hypothetical protein BC830DRAFT_389288 [Chytriomyces sp. MP71]|nr:hypothetical protein BC830DRAFT_389288 [Chytriomyces sp. MP71]
MNAKMKKNWDKIVADSDCETDVKLDRPTPLGLPKSTLHTVPWDPLCEETRWALERHGVQYVEHAAPWPLHLWSVLAHSEPQPHRPQTAVPVWINFKNECYKRSTADVFMFLYAHSFNTTFRVYAEPNALTIQEELGKKLAPAVTSIFLSIILSDAKLTEKYLLSTIHLNHYATTQRLCWPLIRFTMYRYFKLFPADIEKAWSTVRQIFAKVDSLLALQNNKYLAATTFTAADIAFCAQASLVLFPNEEDDGERVGKACGFAFPPLKELPTAEREQVVKLRESAAGKHVIQMYKKERTFGIGQNEYRSFPSKFSKENNPWWSENNGAKLKPMLYFGFSQYVILWITIGMALSPLALLLFALLQVAALAGAYRYFVVGTTIEARLHQIVFLLRGRFEPTQRDKAEAAHSEKEKAAGKDEEVFFELSEDAK